MYVFAYSHREFFVPGKHTSVFRSAVDAFNIFDLFVEVGRNMKWLWTAVILRRPYVRTQQDQRFDIYDAFNGKRDVGAYGTQESYAMIDSPPQRAGAYASEEALPASLVAGGRSPSNGRRKGYEGVKLEQREILDEGYTNRYGEKHV